MSTLEEFAEYLWSMALSARQDDNYGCLLIARCQLRRQNPAHPKLRRLIFVPTNWQDAA